MAEASYISGDDYLYSQADNDDAHYARVLGDKSAMSSAIAAITAHKSVIALSDYTDSHDHVSAGRYTARNVARRAYDDCQQVATEAQVAADRYYEAMGYGRDDIGNWQRSAVSYSLVSAKAQSVLHAATELHGTPEQYADFATVVVELRKDADLAYCAIDTQWLRAALAVLG